MTLSKLLALPAALCMTFGIAAFPLRASAVEMDMDYEGEIDIATGLPVTASSETAPESQQTVNVTGNVTYDRKTHLFGYPVPDKNATVYSSVADGMITTERVSLEIPDGMSVSVYYNGEELRDTDLTQLEKKGTYAVVASGSDTKDQLFSFTIAAQKTGAVSIFEVPDGFQLTKLVLNGDAKKVQGAASINMADDGDYQIGYRCVSSGVTYNLNLVVDHTPPQVTFDGVTNGMASGPVSIKGLEKNDQLQIERNGAEFELNFTFDNVLDTPGEYRVLVTDDAGNTLTESFRIRFYLNFQGVIFTLLAAAVVIGVIVYMYISRKKLKVR